MTTAAERITAASREVLGGDSPLLVAVIGALQDELLVAREDASNAAEEKWLDNLGVAAVVAALSSVAKAKKRKPRKPKAELPLASPVLPVAPTEANFGRSTFANGGV